MIFLEDSVYNTDNYLHWQTKQDKIIYICMSQGYLKHYEISIYLFRGFNFSNWKVYLTSVYQSVCLTVIQIHPYHTIRNQSKIIHSKFTKSLSDLRIQDNLSIFSIFSDTKEKNKYQKTESTFRQIYNLAKSCFELVLKLISFFHLSVFLNCCICDRALEDIANATS